MGAGPQTVRSSVTSQPTPRSVYSTRTQSLGARSQTARLACSATQPALPVLAAGKQARCRAVLPARVAPASGLQRAKTGTRLCCMPTLNLLTPTPSFFPGFGHWMARVFFLYLNSNFGPFVNVAQ